MKHVSSASRRRGFSMIELMVVIGILILLAGLMISALPGIQNRLNRQKVEAFLAELEAGLDKYKVDNGIYPPNPISGNRDASGIEGSMVLYRHLSGDRDPVDGAVDEDEEIYVERLNYDRNKDLKTPRSTAYQGGYVVIDSYNSPIRYLAPPANLPESDRLAQGYRNPTFDLWSIVDTQPGDDSEQALSKHITNWGSN